MGSEVEHKIPIIHFSEESLNPGSESWILASKQVRHGFEEYGCVEIVSEKFPLELHDSFFGAAKDLLDLPDETKMRKTGDRPASIGYVPQRPTAPLYESIGIDSPHTIEQVERFTNVMWPQGNDTFSDAVHSFSKRLVEFTEMVTRMVFESYGVNMGLFNAVMESTFYMLRMFKYRTRLANEMSNLGLASHTDCSFITILHQHHVDGLQIKTKDHRWIDVKPEPSSFIVFAGDALEAWSNDRVRACEHHVIMKENKVRYSTGLFTFIKGLVHVPKELVDDDHPLRYKPFDHFGYFRFFISEEAKKCTAPPIKAYCGIDN